MALNYVSLSSNMNNIYDIMKTTPDSSAGTTWMDNFIIIYDNYANAGTFTNGRVTMTSLPNLLTFDNNAGTCSGATMLAASITNYWKAQIIGSGGSISNDAAKIQTPIETYLCSRISVESSPPYEDLFLFIETQVKGIVWSSTAGTDSIT